MAIVTAVGLAGCKDTGPIGQSRPGEDLLFTITAELESDLNDGTISKELRKAFADHEAPLSEGATISVRQQGRRWLIRDSKQWYALRKEGDQLRAYRTTTPTLYWDLPPQKQAALRATKIYVPDGFGFAQLPWSKGPWSSKVERRVHEGDTEYFLYQLARTMFEFEHPTVMLEWLPFDMWSADFKAILGTSLHSERGPAMYIARSLPESMVDGWFADITDYLNDWPAARDHRLTKAAGTFDERVYCLPGNQLQWPIIAYRKDYFAEAGITNEFGEPGPPSNWTWSGFREYARRLTRDTNGDGKIDRWGFVAEQYRFDLYYSYCERLEYRLFIPDKTGEFTWRFNAEDPQLKEAIRTIREMYWQDKSVLAGVHYTWAVKDHEFAGGRAAMAAMTSAHPPELCFTNPFYFGGTLSTKDVLGMVPIPRDRFGVLQREAKSNMFGFNPLYTPEQLEAAIDWYRSWACGYVRALYLTATQRKNQAWNRPDPFPQYHLVSPFKSEVPLPPSKGREFFPKDYVNVYDVHEKLELFPTPGQFGLLKPIQFGDALNNMFSELLFTTPKQDPQAEQEQIDKILAQHKKKIEARCMKFRTRHHGEKLKGYYTALLDFARRSEMPPEAVRELNEFIETRCKCW